MLTKYFSGSESHSTLKQVLKAKNLLSRILTFHFCQHGKDRLL